MNTIANFGKKVIFTLSLSLIATAGASLVHAQQLSQDKHAQADNLSLIHI